MKNDSVNIIEHLLAIVMKDCWIRITLRVGLILAVMLGFAYGSSVIALMWINALN